MSGPAIRYGLIGAGVAAETHARELAAVRGAEVVAVFARDAGKAERFRAERGIAKAYGDPSLMLADPDIDAVIITTPNGLHLDFARRAAAAGKHVIVEKPLETTTARAKQIIDVCATAGVRLFVIYQRRFAAAVRKARQDVAEGRIGKIVIVNILDNEYRSPTYYARDYWRGTREFEGGGCVLTQSTHLIDLAQHIVGPVESVFAHTKTAFHAIETEDAAVAVLHFANGALGTFSSSTAAYPGHRHLVGIIGTEGSIIFNGEHDQIVLRASRHDDERIDVPRDFSFTDPIDPREYPTLGQRTQLQEITQALATGAEMPGMDADGLLRALNVSDAIYRSAAERREVAIEEIRRES